MLAAVPSRLAPEHPPIAIVFSKGGTRVAEWTPLLTSLGITAIDRLFDHDAPALIAATNPDLVVVLCDPTQELDYEMVESVAGEGIGCVLVVDASGTAAGTIAGLQAGADATLSLDSEEPVARSTITALLRRSRKALGTDSARPRPARVTVGKLTVDNDTVEARDGDYPLPLTPNEFRILSYLASQGGVVRSPSQIMSVFHHHGFTDQEARQTVRVYIRRIRRKLSDNSAQSVEIVNLRVLGYRVQALDRLALRVAASA